MASHFELDTTTTSPCLTPLGRSSYLVEALERPQAERQPLRPTPYPHEAGDGAIVAFFLDAQVGQSILACDKC